MSIKLMSAITTISSAKSVSQTCEESEKLLGQLLECVQQCQKRYGGKTELATEFDNCVAGLCLTLEAIFLHGLRNKPLEVQQSVSSLKQVSEIISNSLSITSDTPSFWPFLKKYLTKHEQDRYLVLKHIWTDVGRCKAWIRSTLNERSLEKYFHTVLSNKETLRTYYEDWALLCDDEKTGMLPNMAAGLCSILFAISIDKPEYNSNSSAQKLERIKQRPEPIIEAPIVEPRKDTKKRRKVAKQLISFDDEEAVLSSSVPSSSSSVTSDGLESRSFRMEEQYKKDELNKKGEQYKKEGLSIEISGSSRERFPSSIIEGTLTPVHSDVGELTPISVEINQESPNTSDDIVEVPMDISAVLTAVESKNLEEINKLKEKISTLNVENESLKEQLNKYISAVQLLNKDEENNSPDYKSEAKEYEKKLVQVAEMHAELMNFNIVLQQTLCQKDNVIQRLKTELEELRGPMNSDDLAEEGRVNVWIPSAFLTGSGSDAHHVYQIFLRAGPDEWNIYRRYAQFHSLHSDLKKLDPVVCTFDFPPKKSLGKKDSNLVEDRRKRLQRYLRRVIAHWPELAQCNSRFLLEQHLAFFKDNKDNEDRNKANRRSAPPSNSFAGL